MGEPEINGKQRVDLVFWHAECCPDGTRTRGKAWKKELAERVGVSQSLVTKLTKPIGKTTVSRETLRRLISISDEAFLGILGFVDKATATQSVTSRPIQPLAQKFGRVASRDDYVDLCIELGVVVDEVHLEDARERAKLREQKLLESTARWRSDSAAYWYQPFRERGYPEPQSVPMHSAEIDAIEELFQRLTSGKTSKTTIVTARPHSGIAYALQRLLPSCKGFRRYYRGGVHHIHIGALEHQDNARNRLINEMLTRAGDQDDEYRQMPNEKKIAWHLHKLDQLLIIHGASAIPDEAMGFIRKLSDELEESSGLQLTKGVSRLILTSWDPGRFRYLRNPISFEYGASISSDDAIRYFNEVLEHYRSIRGKAVQKAVGPRAENTILKRAEHHYRDKVSAFTELPSAVRFRAFCASDTANPSPFDPTQGVWSRVDSAWRDSVPEISDCLSDVQSDLRNYLYMSARDDISALRVVSTGLFFLTRSMLRNLKEHEFSRSVTKSVEITYHLQAKYVNYHPGDGKEASGNYSSPLLVRSIIQDDWMRFDPISRSVVHEAIGDILRDMIDAEDYDELHREIPYSYPWGDGDVVLALESIRHYARAASSSSGDRAIELTRKALDTYDEFLEQGTFSQDDVEASRQVAGVLSRSHGLHALKYEALCLLSPDGGGLNAPLGTNEREQYAFFRELGITYVRMLRPYDAISAFQKCLDAEWLTNFDRSYVLAHGVAAGILADDLQKSAEFLAEARRIEELEPDGQVRNKIRLRNDARSAMLALSRGKRVHSRKLWEEIAEGGLTPFQSDRSIGYFDAFLSSPLMLKSNPALSDNLWASIERASHVALDDGFEHERLRIDIRKASLARIMGFPNAAESILDHVGFDLAKHSGAEILFREFQIESAETLRALNRPRYAFVAYAWPAFQSLRRKSAGPYLRRVRSICAKLLRSMETVTDEPSPATQSNKFWLEISKTSDAGLYPLFSVDLLPSSEDVERYFLDLADAEKRAPYRIWIREKGSAT